MAERFVKTFKRDYVRRMDRSNAASVIAKLPSAFEHYNEVHPAQRAQDEIAENVQAGGSRLNVNSS